MKVVNVLGLAGAGLAALMAYDTYRDWQADATAMQAAPAVPAKAVVEDRAWIKPRDAGAAAPPAAPAPGTRCDGRTHCSHMTSCAEATYFIQHGPNTAMDGDGDGIPCEEQWCG